jgi:hypothetical protein
VAASRENFRSLVTRISADSAAVTDLIPSNTRRKNATTSIPFVLELSGSPSEDPAALTRLDISCRPWVGGEDALPPYELLWARIGSTGWRLLIHEGCFAPGAGEETGSRWYVHHVDPVLFAAKVVSVVVTREVLPTAGKFDRREEPLRVGQMSLRR